MPVAEIKAVFDERYYEDLPGGLLEERSRFMHTLIERIDHDPHAGEIEIKLSEIGLQLLGDNIEDSEA